MENNEVGDKIGVLEKFKKLLKYLESLLLFLLFLGIIIKIEGLGTEVNFINELLTNLLGHMLRISDLAQGLNQCLVTTYDIPYSRQWWVVWMLEQPFTDLLYFTLIYY